MKLLDDLHVEVAMCGCLAGSSWSYMNIVTFQGCKDAMEGSRGSERQYSVSPDQQT